MGISSVVGGGGREAGRGGGGGGKGRGSIQTTDSNVGKKEEQTRLNVSLLRLTIPPKQFFLLLFFPVNNGSYGVRY